MNFPPADLSYLRERLHELTLQIRDAWEASAACDAENDAPALLSDAMLQLIDMLGQTRNGDEETAPSAAEINTLAEYGLSLLDELSQLAGKLEQPALATEIENLSLPFALWVARRGGELRHLAPVVNALAHYANQVGRPAMMSNLYGQCCELIEAASPALEETVTSDPRHPWRLLLLNRAIVATRSHNPELMESAFEAVVECLPHDARTFFAEGMEQMAIIDYPDHVRDIVRRYYLAHALPKRLH